MAETSVMVSKMSRRYTRPPQTVSTASLHSGRASILPSSLYTARLNFSLPSIDYSWSTLINISIFTPIVRSSSAR